MAAAAPVAPGSAVVAAGAGMAALASAATASGVPPRDAAAAAGLAPVFGLLYGAGTLNGLRLRLTSWRARTAGRAR